MSSFVAELTRRFDAGRGVRGGWRRLTAIAPTVVISFQRLSLVEVANRIGTVLGRIAEADQLTARYRDETAAIGRDFAELLRATTVSYVAMAGETTFWTHGPAWTDTSVLLDCGVRLAEPSASQQTATVEYSLERLDVLAASSLLLINAGPDGRTAAEDTKLLTGSKLWATLPAVRAGRVRPDSVRCRIARHRPRTDRPGPGDPQRLVIT